MKMRYWFGALVVVSALVASSHAQPAAAPEQADKPAYTVLQERPDRLFIVLPNRLMAIVQEVHTAPVVSAQVWIKTGSIYEQEHVGAGLSHFLEHLLAGGSTTTRDQTETRKMLGQLGAEFNASTGLASVNYHINTTSDHAVVAVDLLSDWMQNSLITKKEYQREGQVIQREFDLGEGDPGRVTWMLVEQNTHQFHPARDPTIGYISEFLSITRDEIYDFYKRMYVPNNMVMVVVGDVDKHAIADQIAKDWAKTPAGPLPKLSFPIEPEITEPKNVTGTATIVSPRLSMIWPSTRMAGPDDYATDLLGAILGQGESSRLVRSVRDEAGAVSVISSDNSSFPWGEGFFSVDAQIALDSKPGTPGTPEEVKAAVDKAKGLIVAQIAKVQADGVTDEELARAKRKIVHDIAISAQSADGLARRLAGGVIDMGDPDFVLHYGQAIQRVTAQEVRAVAQRYLQPHRLVAITLLPPPPGTKIVSVTRPPEPPRPADLKTEPIDLDNSVLLAKFSALQTGSAPAAPAPSVEVGPVHTYKLSNGLRVLVQRNTLVPAVSIQLYELGGLLADVPGEEGIANAAAAMLVKGTTTRTAQQLGAEVENLGAALDTAGGSNTLYIRASCLKDDWARVLELTADVTLHPTFPDKEWSLMQKRLAAYIERETESWGGELSNRFRATYFGKGNTWSQSTFGRASVIQAAKAQDLAAFYRDHLGASQAVLAIFGDVDEAKVVEKAEALFASMPADANRRVVVSMPSPAKSGLWEFPTEKKVVGVRVGYGPAPTRLSPDYATVQVLIRVLSAFPAGWLEEELRGKGPGLVYVTGAGMFTGVAPGYIGVTFNTQPTNAVEALKRTAGVIQRAIDTQVDDATLARAKASVLTDEFFYKQTNSDRAADAALNVLYGLGVDAPKQMLERVRQLNAADIQAIARAYLRNPVAVIIASKEVDRDDLRRALGLLPPLAPTTMPATTEPQDK